MADEPNIVWLASYPKSGNTWFRAFLTALLSPGSTDIDINNLYQTTIASSRLLFDEMTGIASSDLEQEEIDRLRPLVYCQYARETEEILYQKVHDAWTLLPGGQPLFPSAVTRAVLYFIRNPLDVTVSFAHHLNTSLDKTIAILNNPGYAFCQRTDRLHNQLRQRLLTWSGHVTSWVDDSGLPVLVMRYEDMKAQPVKTFARAVDFIGLQHSRAEIEAALDRASFARLQQQEAEKGFSEKNACSGSFFRKGEVGDWKNVLSAAQAERVTQAHGGVMGRFGYL